MPKTYAIELNLKKMSEVFGETLIGVREMAQGDDTDPPSVILDFTNGKEIEVWIKDDGALRIESD